MRQQQEIAEVQGVYPPPVVHFACGCLRGNGTNRFLTVYVRRCAKHAGPQISLSGRLRSLENIQAGHMHKTYKEA